MSKKVYVIKNGSEKEYFKLNLTQFIVGLIVYACIIVISSNLFENMYVESFGYALLASFIISMLNYAVKPLLVFLTMPLSIFTFGISYPIVNVIVLKLCGFLMGDAFNITGIFAPFIIAIFISFMKILFDNLITNRIGDGR